MGYDGSNFHEQMEAWRESRYLKPKDVVRTYRDAVNKLLQMIKGKYQFFPESASVKVLKAEASQHATASLDYGRGGEFNAETRIKPLEKTYTTIDILELAAHEIGVHYFAQVLLDLYARETGDLLGAVGTMSTSLTCPQEGLAENSLMLYRDELIGIFGEEIAEDLDFWRRYNAFSTDKLGYIVDRRINDRMTKEVMVKELVGFGSTEEGAANLADGLMNPINWIKVMTYVGPVYAPSTRVLNRMIKTYGPQKVLEAFRYPITLSALPMALKEGYTKKYMQ